MISKFYSKVNDVAFDVLDKIAVKCQNHYLCDDDILIIHSIFGSVFERSTEILEKSNAVTFYVLDGGVRTIAEVKGHSDRTYKLIPEINFCPCPAFQFKVLKSSSELTCKHVLAVWLAKVTNKYQEQKISQQQYSSTVCSIYMLDIQVEES